MDEPILVTACSGSFSRTLHGLPILVGGRDDGEPDLDHVLSLLASPDADVNARGIWGESALHRAAIAGTLPIVKALVERGADTSLVSFNTPDLPLDQGGNIGGLPYTEACYHGRNDVVAFLLDHGSPIDAVDMIGNTGLSHAAGNGHLSTVKLLIQRGANVALVAPTVHSAVFDGAGAFTPIEIASIGCHTEVVQALLEAGSPMDTLADSAGHTCLMGCTIFGFLDLALMLIHHCTDPQEYIRRKDNSDCSALHYAVLRSHKPLVRALLEFGGSPNQRDFGEPALSLATGIDLEMVMIFLEAGADVHGRSQDGVTALHEACFTDSLDICLELVRRGANPNATNAAGTTCLALYGQVFEVMGQAERVLSPETKQQRREALEDARKTYLDAIALRARREGNWRRRRLVVMWNSAAFELPDLGQAGGMTVAHVLRAVADREAGLFDRVIEYL